MPEETAVVEKPVVPLSEQEITDTYLEKRMEGAVDDLPVPPPGIPDAPPPVIEPPVEIPSTPEVVAIQEVDKYIEEREGRKDVKRKRAGKQTKIDERIDQLTKEKADAEERAAKLEAEKAHAPIPPGTIKETEEKPPVEAAATTEPKPRPRMNEFTDADEYHAAMALWAVEESTRGKPVPKAEQEPPKPPEYMQVRKEEFDKFLEKGKSFIVTHPDFNDTLQQAAVRGLTISEQARTAITRLAVPEVAYWLAKPENDLAARSLMGMDDLQQVVEVGRIAERLTVSPSDFVSRAPAPLGVRIAGNANHELPINQVTDTDEYIRRRRQERRTKRGR